MMHLARLVIPEADPSSAIPARYPVAARAEIKVHRVSARVVASELLLAVLTEAVGGGVDDDFVVATLEADGFSGWMRGCGCEGEHVWFGDEFDWNGNVQLPRPQGLVIRSGNEATVFVNEGDGVDWAKMVVVFLRHFAGAGIVLDDLLIGHTS